VKIEVDEPGETGLVRQYIAYDGLGRKLQQTDAAGRITTFLYDALGHCIARTLPGL
jgi:YD repeat-containing protein